MVYLSGSKRARLATSSSNFNQGGGGAKKQGLASTIGIDSSVSGIYRKRIGCLCPTYILSTTKSCAAGVGGIRRYRC